MLFLLDRVTGKPIYEVKEVPVFASAATMLEPKRLSPGRSPPVLID